MSNIKTTWEEGANAYHKGLTLLSNPYIKGTDDYNSWKASYLNSAGISSVKIGVQYKKFIVIDGRTGLKWANEFFKTKQDAVNFCKVNNLTLL